MTCLEPIRNMVAVSLHLTCNAGSSFGGKSMRGTASNTLGHLATSLWGSESSFVTGSLKPAMWSWRNRTTKNVQPHHFVWLALPQVECEKTVSEKQTQKPVCFWTKQTCMQLFTGSGRLRASTATLSTFTICTSDYQLRKASECLRVKTAQTNAEQIHCHFGHIHLSWSVPNKVLMTLGWAQAAKLCSPLDSVEGLHDAWLPKTHGYKNFV